MSYCFFAGARCTSQYCPSHRFGQPGNEHGFFGFVGNGWPPFRKDRSPRGISPVKAPVSFLFRMISIHRRFKLILERSGCKNIRFHDLRHTFATMALENGMDVKTLSDMIGHISAETTLNIYAHITDTMRAQASVKIDRKIGGTDAPMPEAKEELRQVQTSNVDENFEPWQPKYRKPGTGCVYQINDTLWEGSFYPRMPDGKRKKFNVYAKTREECEKLLAEMIAEKKAEIAAEKANTKTA